VNRPWTDDEIATVLKHAPMSLKSAVLIALCTSLREGDVAKVPWSIYDGTMIDATHGKNGQHLYVRAHPLLKKCLDGLPNNPAKIEDPKAKKLAMTQPIVIGDRSRKPYHGYGFYSRFWKFISKLETDGLVGPGLTFHGLRHSVATRLAEAGATTHQIMAITGHRDEATVKLYIAKADKKKWAAQAMDLLSLPV
jgi:integrase